MALVAGEVMRFSPAAHAAIIAVALAAVPVQAQPGPTRAPAEVETPLPWFGASRPDQSEDAPAPDALLGAVEARDPRVAEADGYLADRATYADAIALYRSYLTEQPEDHAVRLRLARVISWTGRLDDALVEYDTLARKEPSSAASIERAEVLSWAGRYREAEAAFREILVVDASNARAARGLARVFLWSGRAYEADRAYARALEMEDDDESRSEWEGLHSLYRPQVGARVSRRSDNDDYFFQSLESQGATYLNLRTRIAGEVSYWRTRGEIDLGGGIRERRRHEGAAYTLGVEHHLSPAWLATAHLGHEAWGGAPDQVLAGTELRFTPVDSSSLAFGYEHSGAGKPLESFDAVEEGIRRDELSLSLWQDLPGKFEVWSRVGGGWISDHNNRVHSSISFTYKPLEDREFGIHLSNTILHYLEDSNFYYDPDLDVDNELSADYVQPLLLGLRLRIETAVGYGLSRDLGQTSDGFVFRTGSYLWWEWRRWALEVGGTFSQSRRDSVYRSNFFTAGLTRTF